MSFTPMIAPEIYARHPNFHLLSIVVRNAEVSVPAAPALADVIAAAEQAALGEDAQRDAHLAAWAEAYGAFGAKANRTPCSAAALLKRIRKDGSLPRIFPLVDAYNAISVLYGVPVGGEDLDHYQGLPRLLIATGAEPFDTVQQGEPVTEHPEPGEVVWCDYAGVTCRRWNWRQGRRTMVTAASRSLWLVLEALEPMPGERLRAAGAQLTGLIEALCPNAQIEITGLNKSTFCLSRAVERN
ncbi:phenylalanine--tRNA ligase beta subunit-related protein [Mesorhizobium sp. M1233]|uniref:B3/B4 domain-containing protein n=1 Tax=unclassified Mesorhizobium TaxID=325217 RepID=UPI00333C0F1B